jgi:hypothetical protein
MTTPDSFETTIATACAVAGVPVPDSCDGTDMIRFYRDESGWHAGASEISAHTTDWSDEWTYGWTDATADEMYNAPRVGADDEDADEDAGDYVVVGPEWGPADVTPDEDRAACTRMEAQLNEHAPTGFSFRVRLARKGEAAGTYLDLCTGSLQILGYSIPVPERVREMVDVAYAHAMETWPVETNTTTPPAPGPVRKWAQQIIDYIDAHRDDWLCCAWTEILTRDVPVDDDIITMITDIDGVDPDDYDTPSSRTTWSDGIIRRTCFSRDTVALDGCTLGTHADALVVEAIEKARSICEDAKRARTTVEQCRLALGRFLQGNAAEGATDAAARGARYARDIEADYGDAPIWGWLADQVEHLHTMAEEARDTGQWEIAGATPRANMKAVATAVLMTIPPPVHGDELHVRVETQWIDARPASYLRGYSTAYNDRDDHILLVVKDVISGVPLRAYCARKGSDEIRGLGPVACCARTKSELFDLDELDDALEGRR